LKPLPKKLAFGETEKCLIFVKLCSQKVFSPIQLQTKTLDELLNRLKDKFPEFPSKKISHIYFKTCKDLIFYFDEEMMDQILPNHVIEIDIEVDPDDPTMHCLNMNEINHD